MTRSEQTTLQLLQALNSENPKKLSSSVRALAQIGSETAVNGLLSALNHLDDRVSGWAAWALGQIATESVVAQLIDILNHKSPQARKWAASALGQIHTFAATQGLLFALNDEDSDVRVWAASALGKIRDEAAVARLLIVLNEDGDASVRSRAASALGKIRAEAACSGLLLALHDQDSLVRSRAALALGKIGAKTAVEPLLSALSDLNFHVRWSATKALELIGSEKAVSGLLRALKNDPDPYVRSRAASALGQIGSVVAKAELKIALNDPDSFVRERVIEALKQIDTRASLAFRLTQVVDFGSKQEKEKLTPSSTIVLDPQLDKLPTIFITNRIEASQRILGQTTEPFIKHIISICDPSEPSPPGYTQVFHRLRLEFDDITTPVDDPEDVLAAPADILQVIDFTQAMQACGGDVLIHCFAGVSRSTAIALIVYAVLLGVGKEESALAYVLKARPQAVPNPWIVELADEALGRNGKLLQVVQTHEDSLLENH
ncbi:MAG: HEAT repeat domain-containing protein [Cyanobacteriota bacterium]